MNEITASIFCKQNPYGYALNVNHPTINKYYLRYKASKGYDMQRPLSDEERKEFESYLIPKVTRGSNPPLERKTF